MRLWRGCGLPLGGVSAGALPVTAIPVTAETASQVTPPIYPVPNNPMAT